MGMSTDLKEALTAWIDLDTRYCNPGSYIDFFIEKKEEEINKRMEEKDPDLQILNDPLATDMNDSQINKRNRVIAIIQTEEREKKKKAEESKNNKLMSMGDGDKIGEEKSKLDKELLDLEEEIARSDMDQYIITSFINFLEECSLAQTQKKILESCFTDTFKYNNLIKFFYQWLGWKLLQAYNTVIDLSAKKGDEAFAESKDDITREDKTSIYNYTDDDEYEQLLQHHFSGKTTLYTIGEYEAQKTVICSVVNNAQATDSLLTETEVGSAWPSDTGLSDSDDNYGFGAKNHESSLFEIPGDPSYLPSDSSITEAKPELDEATFSGTYETFSMTESRRTSDVSNETLKGVIRLAIANYIEKHNDKRPRRQGIAIAKALLESINNSTDIKITASLLVAHFDRREGFTKHRGRLNKDSLDTYILIAISSLPSNILTEIMDYNPVIPEDLASNKTALFRFRQELIAGLEHYN